MRRFVLAGVGLSLLLASCDESSSQKDQAMASASAELVEPKPPPPPPPPPPADIDLGGLQEQLGCLGKRGAKGKNACRVLEQFAQAERWTSDVPSGVGKWFGRAYVVKKGEEELQYVMLRSRRVPTATVGPGELALMVGMGSLPDELDRHSAKLAALMGRGARGKKKNLAFRELEAFDPKQEQSAVNTKGKSVQLVADIGGDQTYLRQQTIKKLFIVQTAEGRGVSAGDGLYAELWLGAW